MASLVDVAKQLPDQTFLVLADHEDQCVAGALMYRSDTHLYGRHWGCSHNFDSLHFEACYYQGIEFCIKHGLQRFDPGAQGEHKIPRGFKAITTYSNHKIMNAEFSKAINHFIDEECIQVTAHIEHLNTLLPFKLAQEPSNK